MTHGPAPITAIDLVMTDLLVLRLPQSKLPASWLAGAPHILRMLTQNGMGRLMCKSRAHWPQPRVSGRALSKFRSARVVACVRHGYRWGSGVCSDARLVLAVVTVVVACTLGDLFI
jgi:hypothetical protein